MIADAKGVRNPVILHGLSCARDIENTVRIRRKDDRRIDRGWGWMV
jgi:hypothetical protein